MTPSFAAPATVRTESEFGELRSLIKEQHLLERRAIHSVPKMVTTAILLATSFTVLAITDHLVIQLFNTVLLGFALGQVGLIAHDAGHQQVFTTTWKNDLLGYISFFILGSSYQWWNDKHNSHHANPNHQDMDPDIDIPFLAFSEEQVHRRGKVMRWMLRYQAWLFFPILTLTTYSFRVAAMTFLARNLRRKRIWLDIAAFVLHLILYLGILFWLLPWPVALIFVVVHQAVWSFYLGMIFAPNHKGMPIFNEKHSLGFLRQQVLTSRNVRGGRIIDFVYGGLNYQIEHHLFPTMPRWNLKYAKQIVERFCKERGIAYYETGFIQSYAEILSHMKDIGRLARTHFTMA